MGGGSSLVPITDITIQGEQFSIKGTAEIGINSISCVCGKCGNQDLKNASIEFNFKEMKVYYLCSECRFMNEMHFGKESLPPLPRTSVRR